VEYFKHLGCLITSYERCLSETEDWNAITTAEFKKKDKGEIFATKYKVKQRKNVMKFYIWSINFFGAET